MSSMFDNIYDKYEEASISDFRSDKVSRIMDTFDEFVLTPGDLRGEEPKLKQLMNIANNEVLREEEITKNLTSSIQILESEHLNLLKEKVVIEAQIKEKLMEKIPSNEDEEILSKLGKTLRLYKDVTNIRWDYSAPKNLIKGYVYGNLKNYVHAFEIPTSSSEVADILWQEIEAASVKTSQETRGKENVFHDNIISAPK